jgi:hypothetical protein
MKISSVRWGVIWIGIGLFFLAINLEMLDSLIFPRLFSLWPVLLIAIGVELLFRRTKLYFLALLSPLLIAAAFIFAATAKGEWKWRADEFWTRWTLNHNERRIDTVEIPADTTVKSLDINFNCGSGKVSLRPISNVIFKANSEYDKRRPSIEYEAADGVEEIKYTNREKAYLEILGLNLSSIKNDFEIADYLPLKADFLTYNREPELDFSALKLTDLVLDLHSSRGWLRFGALSDMVEVSISGNVRRLELVIPQYFGLAVIGDSGKLQNLIHDPSLLRSTDGFYSSNYGESMKKISVNLNADVNSLMISRY